MIKVYKYRLYPNPKQIEILESQLESHRCLYNQALYQRREYYEKNGKGLSCFSQIKSFIPDAKAKDEGIASCNCSSLQQTLRRVDKTYKAFFRRVKAGGRPGYPRYKSETQFNTIQYAVLGDGCQIKNGSLYLQNIGDIKVKWYRLVSGKIKTLAVTRKNGKWYVLFFVEYAPTFFPANIRSVGIDVGLTTFASLSDGSVIDSPKFAGGSEVEIKKASQRLSRRVKGSGRRKKARLLLAKTYERIVNRRLDFFHKATLDIIRAYGKIAVENLNISGMIKNHHLAHGIADAGWGLFLTILKAKAENAGREYIEVNPKNTSQECSGCGAIVKKSLAVRVHACPSCGLVLDRDHNAAINILARTGPSVLAHSY